MFALTVVGRRALTTVSLFGTCRKVMKKDLRYIANQTKQRQRQAAETTEDIPQVDADVQCPVCKAKMTLRRHTRFGLFWGCPTYAACGTSHGAHADGTPLGVPADQHTKTWRHRAHVAFDRLWESGRLSRTDAYAWLCQVMEKTQEEGHIGRFTIEECKLLIEKIEERDRTKLRRPR